MKNILQIAAMIILLMSPLGAFSADKDVLVGGQCTYDAFPGTCIATDVDQDGKTHFTYKGKVRGNDLKLKKNTTQKKLSIGKKVRCELKFIKTGTCTPCLFSIGECGSEAWETFRSMKKP